jgi:hypothetical protein
LEVREAGPQGPASSYLQSIVRAMKRNRVATFAALLGLVALLGLAGPVSATEVIASHGKTGDWGYNPSDDSSHPVAKCGYSAPNGDGIAYLRWIKVQAPRVAARDITLGPDHQLVSWQAIIQRSSASGWTTIKNSPVHQFTAYDNSSSAHSAVKVYVNGTNDASWRAVIRINWLRNGSTEGWIKARIEYYGVKWTVGNPDYVFTDACGGQAD